MKKSKIQLIICLIVVFINSLYITGVVNRYTLSTGLQYFFVVCYFIALFGITGYYLLSYIKKKIKMNKKGVFKKIVIAIFLSSLLISAGGDLFNNHKFKSSTITITATGDKNIKSNSTEVWLTGVKVNGIPVNLQDLNASYDSGDWQFREGALLSNSEKPSSIIINFPAAKEIQISFLKHDWSGIVNVTDSGSVQKIDLYDQVGGDYFYSIKGNIAPFSYKVILDYGMAFLLCLTVVLIILMLSYIHFYAYGFLFSGLYAYLFIVTRIMNIDKVSDIILLLISFLVGSLFGKMVSSSQINLPNKGIHKFIFLFVVIYAAFAGVGTILFFEKGIFELNFHDIAFFLLFCFWVFPFIVSFIRLLKFSERYVFFKEKNPSGFKLWCLLFSIQLVFGLFYLLAYYPANMSQDSINQWGQAIGVDPMSDWHPAFHTFTNILILSLYKSPVTIAVFQIVFSAVIVSSFLTLLYRNGFSKKWLIIFVIIFSLMPNNGINLVTLWKDIPFTISILWLTLSLARIKLLGDKALTTLNLVSLIGSLVCVCLFRHNGAVPFILTILSLLIIAIKNKNYKILGGLLASITLVLVIKGAIFSYYNVIPNPAGIKLVAPIHGVASVIHKGGDLSPETQDFMKELMPFEDWEKLYTPYSANSYMFDNKFDVVNKLSKEDTVEIIKLYISTFFRNPSIVLYDRLTGINLMWDITQPETVYAYNYRFSNEVLDNNFGIQREGNLLTRLMDSILLLSYKIKLSDIVIWRGGIYTLVCLILLYYTIAKKAWGDFLIMVPFLGNILSLLLSMSSQDYRYVYFEFYTIWFIIGTIVCTKTEKSNLNYNREVKVERGINSC